VTLDRQGPAHRGGPYSRAIGFDDYKVVLYRQDEPQRRSF
jgi:hypothetical protein